jgi:flavin reductase (DIM6/NTAB) family NADH-FMN oxidoreductase RutF
MPSVTVHRLEPLAPSRTRVADATGATFREAVRQLATGVCVVTLGTGDERMGLTATSVSSFWTDPPTLLLCVRRALSSYPTLVRLGAFAVSVLAADQREFAERFAGDSDVRGAERFAEGRWLSLPSGILCLADSIGVFDCEVDECIERHTHAIVISRVLRLFVGKDSGALISWRGSYDQVGWSSDEISRGVGLIPSGGN